MIKENLKIVIITDVHGNLPALKAVLNEVEDISYDYIVHLGDSIGIGPFPKECLELLLRTDKLSMIMGNHEAYFAFGIPNPHPSHMSDGEYEHQKWVHSTIGESLKLNVSEFPYSISRTHFNINVTFIHYPLVDSCNDFKPICKEPNQDNLDQLFKNIESDIIFYGHHHPFSDIKGRGRYINPGSLGCSHDSLARFTILEISKEQYSIKHKMVTYLKDSIFEEFEKREVPERELISKLFFGKH
ncbi:metallophosphoesterase [Clostridium sp. CF012]|uniref:metallophosphoesterase family protein n=1 Tax=Clostridium sp. CF012 TaxID=2843319 RepID=UPI001C0D4A7B|nr:metallophosphoesterase family protein [Clostridium sp. CF012]MBU3143813.1 metallophosphatase family protein [Clostridium sp. CF012]